MTQQEIEKEVRVLLQDLLNCGYNRGLDVVPIDREQSLYVKQTLSLMYTESFSGSILMISIFVSTLTIFSRTNYFLLFRNKSCSFR